MLAKSLELARKHVMFNKLQNKHKQNIVNLVSTKLISINFICKNADCRIYSVEVTIAALWEVFF